MRNALSYILVLAALVGVLPATASAAALPVVMRDTRWYDARLVDAGKKLDVTGRVIRREIVKDVIRVQTLTVNGEQTVVCRAVMSSMAAIQTHCDRSRTADGESSALCHYVPEAQCFPTVSK